MKKTIAIIMCAGMISGYAKADLILTGIIDASRTGGTPKAIELYASADIADLSVWDVQYYFNANATPSTTVALSGSVNAGDYIYIASEATEFTAYFGFAPTFTGGGSVNGDDSVVLRLNGIDVDVYGNPGIDGTGASWEYLDSWAYRVDGTGVSTTWNAADWTSPGINALDPLGSTGVNPPASGDPNSALHMPIGTYVVPEPATMSMLLLGLVGARGMIHRRKRS